jgi:hypothetical protein
VLSTTVIERPLTLLVVDCTGAVASADADVARRLLAVLAKRGVALVDAQPIVVADGAALARHAGALAAASVVVVIGDAEFRPGACLDAWRWMSANVAGPTLVVACQFGDADDSLATALLRTTRAFAPIALAPESTVAPRAGALFLLKFLAELHLHTDDGRVTGRMAWFAHKKAAELVRRRGLDASFGLRA